MKSKIGEIYALKVVYLDKLKKDSDRHNALNEIRILSSLDHPNVIKLDKIFLEDDNNTL